MVAQDSRLVTLLKQVDRMPMPAEPVQKGRGRPVRYEDRLIVKAVLVMNVRHHARIHDFYQTMLQPTPEMQQLRDHLSVDGHFASRRTWERRLKAIAARLPDYIGTLGRYLVEQMGLWQTAGRAVALDSTVLRASGVVWHQKQREKGEVPVGSIDTDAHWTKSGWHGWVYGWKLHVAATVADRWLPIAAELTPANGVDSVVAPRLLHQLPLSTRFVLGDLHYNREALREECWHQDRLLVTTKYGTYPHTDDGAQVRSVFHKLRSIANENFNEHFKSIFGVHGAIATKGEAATQRFALGAVLLYQVAVWLRFEQGEDPCVGLKAFLKAA